MRIFILLLSASLLGGCANTYTISHLGGGESGVQLEPTEAVYVAVPEDGSFGGNRYHGSGQQVANLLAAEFSKYAAQVRWGNRAEDEQAARVSASERDATVLVLPTILHWEHRNTAWSGLPNKSTIRVQIIDVVSDRQLDAVVIEGHGRIMSFGGDTPEGLLPAPVQRYVRALYH
jgi:hypothetical protein